MDREEAKKILPVFQAFAEGKEIQFYSPTTMQWEELVTPAFSPDYSYRVKPEQREYWLCWDDKLPKSVFNFKPKIRFDHAVRVKEVMEQETQTNNESSSARFTPRDGVVHDAMTGLEWSQEDVTSEPVHWEKADAACRDLRLGGHSDWRLPTRTELLTLVDDTRHSPAINVDAFPSCKSAWYWPATPYNPLPSVFAWGVDFYDGLADVDLRGRSGRVRAVRCPARQ